MADTISRLRKDRGKACRRLRVCADEQTLGYHVRWVVLCEDTGQSPGMRRAVALLAELGSGRRATLVMTADAWDRARGMLHARLPGVTVRWLDDSCPFGRRSAVMRRTSAISPQPAKEGLIPNGPVVPVPPPIPMWRGWTRP